MPLNTAQLSPARRAVAAAVLVLLLAVSLGFAQVLVLHARKAPVEPGEMTATSRGLSFSCRWPAGFHRVTPPDGVPGDLYTGSVGGAERTITIIVKADPDNVPVKIAARSIKDMIVPGTSPKIINTQLGGNAAVDLFAPLRGDSGFVRLRGCTVGGTFVGVLYLGVGEWTPQDDVNFETTAGKSFQLRPGRTN